MTQTNSFKLLGQAFKSAREPMWASVQVLIVLTVILATVFFIAEYEAQPEEYNYGRSLLWAFTRYIGDPGKFSGPGPITFTGRLVACLIGIVGILIFAVPAGLVGSGFRTAIDKEIRKKHLKTIGEKLKMAFTSEQDSITMYEYIPRYISIGTLQAKKNMTERDVMEAVEYNPTFRLRNLATAEAQGKHSRDQLVVEMFPLNTPYGVRIDRNSNVTIVCTESVEKAGFGNFGYYLSLLGGFNFISKEINQNVHHPVSYYLIDDNNSPENRKLYLEDLKRLSQDKEGWYIFVISSDRESENAFHFIAKAWPKATGRSSTIMDWEKFKALYDKLSITLFNEFKIKSELDEEYRPAGSKNIAVKIGGGIETNAFSIRISNELIAWDPRYIAICKAMAIAINSTIGNPDYQIPDKKLKQEVNEYYLD